MEIVEVRFRTGKNQRFIGAREAAKSQGYPDVISYLRSTGQVNNWCEEIPEEEIKESLKVEECRLKTLRISAAMFSKTPT